MRWSFDGAVDKARAVHFGEEVIQVSDEERILFENLINRARKKGR